MQAGGFLQHPKRKIARAATEVEDGVLRLEMALAGLRDQFQHQRRVDRRLLAGRQIAEPLDVLVEPGANFFRRGFADEGIGHLNG